MSSTCLPKRIQEWKLNFNKCKHTIFKRTNFLCQIHIFFVHNNINESFKFYFYPNSLYLDRCRSARCRTCWGSAPPWAWRIRERWTIDHPVRSGFSRRIAQPETRWLPDSDFGLVCPASMSIRSRWRCRTRMDRQDCSEQKIATYNLIC